MSQTPGQDSADQIPFKAAQSADVPDDVQAHFRQAVETDDSLDSGDVQAHLRLSTDDAGTPGIVDDILDGEKPFRAM